MRPLEEYRKAAEKLAQRHIQAAERQKIAEEELAGLMKEVKEAGFSSGKKLQEAAKNDQATMEQEAAFLEEALKEFLP